MEQTSDYLSKEFCETESKKYTSRGSFAKGCPSAYNKARKEGWLNEYVWLKPQRHEKGYWTEARCESIARAYQRMYDFQTENYGAYNAAKRNGWLKNYTWLEMVYSSMKPRGYWNNYQNCYAEAQLHKTLHSFARKSGSAYNSALKHGWLDDYTWFEGERRKGKEHYTYEICCELSKICQNRTEFARKHPTAYNVSNENGWLDKFTWLKHKKRKMPVAQGYWSIYENCLNESLKYSKRSEFRKKSNSAYKSSVKNGWIDDFTWLEKWNNNRIWTKEVCECESRRFDKLTNFRKECPRAYDAAIEHGWLKDYIWLERTIKPNGYWNETTCREEALKYKTLKLFREECGTAYNKAYQNDWLKDYTWLKAYETSERQPISEEKKDKLHKKFAKTTEQFIEQARAIHGEKYNYSKTVYVKNCEKVCIICPDHGEFWQIPKIHLKGCGCKECGIEATAKSIRKTQEQFIKEVKKLWGDKLDFSKVEYKSSQTPVCIICHKKDKDGNEHGEFYPSPVNLLNGHGCPKCGFEKNAEKSRKGVNKLIEEIYKVHGGKYEIVDLSEYVNTESKIIMRCPIHGEFKITPHSLLSGQGCSKCGAMRGGEKTRLTQEEFIKRAQEVHGDKYDYSKVVYELVNKPVTIICPIHGEFKQMPGGHMSGQGCPRCHESHNERDVSKAFDATGIIYERQKRFPWLGLQSLDFYILDKNIGVECQSSLHYNDNFLRLKKGEEYAKQQLAIIKERDARKKRLCTENGVHLVYFMKKKFLKYANKNDVNFTSFNDLVAYILGYQNVSFSEPSQMGTESENIINNC